MVNDAWSCRTNTAVINSNNAEDNKMLMQKRKVILWELFSSLNISLETV